MKNAVLFCSLLIIIVLGSSCSAGKLLTSDVKPAEVNDILVIEPLSYISLIEKGNNGVYNDSISKKNQVLLAKSLSDYLGRLPVSQKEVILADSLEKEKTEREIKRLILYAERDKNVKNIPITPLIDSLLTKNEKRFALILLQNGFTRNKGNYGSQIAKGIGMGILTLGMYYQTPIKSNSIIYAIIVDGDKKNIAFYNKSILQDKEPADENNIARQLQKVFGQYFEGK